MVKVGWCLGALVVLLMYAWTNAGPALASPPPRTLTSPIQLALFYHPPRDGTSLETIADRFASAIFTRGDERYRDQLRLAGFRGPILQYLVINEASGPGRLNRASDPCDAYLPSGNDVTGIAGDFCSRLHPFEDVFLHNGRGERLYSTLSWEEMSGTKTRYYYVMNPGSARWREYFAEHAADNARSMGYSGLFIDNIDRSLERPASRSENSDGTVQEYSSDERYRADVLTGLASLRGRIGALPLWGNVTSSYLRPNDGNELIPYLDAVMNEYFVGLWRGQLPRPAHWEAQLVQAETVLQAGRRFIAVAQGQPHDQERLRFAIASFLLVATEHAYFRYTDDATYDQAWLYDDYTTGLGDPLGPRYQGDGGWHRDFQCGRVSVNPTSHRGIIEHRGPGCV